MNSGHLPQNLDFIVLAPPQTRKRETAALGEAMAELGLRTGIIVTRGEKERIAAEAGTIEVIPAWRFFLDLPDSEAVDHEIPADQ